jgi:hypothetical protein
MPSQFPSKLLLCRRLENNRINGVLPADWSSMTKITEL